MTASDPRWARVMARDRTADGQFWYSVATTGIYCRLSCPSSAQGVAAILMGYDPDALVRDLQDRFPRARLIGGDPEYERFVARVVGFIEAPRLGLERDGSSLNRLGIPKSGGF